MIRTVLRIYRMSGDLKKRLFASFIFSFFEASCANVPVIVLLLMFFKLLDGTLTQKASWSLFGGLVIGILLRMVFRYLRDSKQQGAGYTIFANERLKVGSRLKRYPMGYYSDDSIGNITSVLTNDMIFIEDTGMGAIGNFVASVVGLLVSVFMISLFDWRIGLILCTFIMLSLLSIQVLKSKSVEGAVSMQERQKNLVNAIIEYIKGIPVIKAFSNINQSHESTSQAFKDFHDIQIAYELAVIKSVTIVWILIGVGTAGIVAVSALMGYMEMMAVPFTVTLMIFSFQLFNPIELIATVVAPLYIVEAGLNRYDSLEAKPIIDEEGQDIELENFDITFENVCFSYDTREILHGVTFSACEKTMTALVGRSGSGKSTMVNLIARFWDVNSGCIKIGGIDIRDISIDCLYRYISVVFQDVYLFNDTIYNNILFGNKHASKEEVIAACKKARCHDFIIAMEEGYETLVGEGGNTLSGGEKQRISIARAILKDAPIILLDEATAAIDPDNEAHIQSAINELIKDKTLIVIAHKLSSIIHSDKILVIDEGNVIEQGTHKELLAYEGVYSRLWEMRHASQSWEVKQ